MVSLNFSLPHQKRQSKARLIGPKLCVICVANSKQVELLKRYKFNHPYLRDVVKTLYVGIFKV